MDSLLKKSEQIIKIIGGRSYVSFEELIDKTGITEDQLIQVKTTLEKCLKKEDNKITVTISYISPNIKGFIIE